MNKRKGLSSQGFLPWWITVPVFLIICGSLLVNLVQYQAVSYTHLTLPTSFTV